MEGDLCEIIDLDAVCRLCLQSNSSLFPIFSESEIDSSSSQAFASKISACVGFEISNKEEFPPQICEDCSDQVERWFVFRQRCKDINETLSRAAQLLAIVTTLQDGEKIIEGVPSQENDLGNCRQQDFSSDDQDISAQVPSTPKDFDTLEAESASLSTIANEQQENVISDEQQIFDDGGPPQNESDCDSEVSDSYSLSSDEGTEGKTDNSETSWRRKPTACPICRKPFGQFSGVKLHLKVVHNVFKKLYPCLICAHISCVSTDRPKHIAKKHPIGTLRKNTCPMCGIYVKSTSSFNRHLKRHEAARHCEECNIDFGSEEDVLMHKKSVHVQKEVENPSSIVDHRYSCHLCTNVTFKKVKAWRQHYQDVHETQEVHPCNSCDRAFRTTKLLEIHVRSHTGEKPYMCDVCATKCCSKKTLMIHLRKHTTKFQCSLCQKTFSTKTNLIIHKRHHTDEKPYICHECGRSFKSPNGLDVHIRGHSGEKPFTCDICDFRCAVFTNLQVHKAKHSDVRPFKCDTCNKSFKLKAWLKEHQKTHSGVKNFVCEICQHAFIAKYQLNCHMKTHSGEKPYVCDICSKRFARRDTLNEHKSVHSKKINHSCNNCKREFMSVKHLKNHHCGNQLMLFGNQLSYLDFSDGNKECL